MSKRKKKHRSAVPSMAAEFDRADLGDVRRTAVAKRIAEACSAAPDQSFPVIARSPSELEATYRFLENPRFDAPPLVDAHVGETWKRAAACKLVLVPQDTSEFAFKFGEHQRRGLEVLRGGRAHAQGFHAHVGLAIDGDTKRPLGVVGFDPWVRRKKGRSKKNGRNRSGSEYAKDQERESLRWHALADKVDAAKPVGVKLIHLMDREGDAFPLLHRLAKGPNGFIVRLSHDRPVKEQEDDDDYRALRKALAELKPLGTREVTLSARAAKRQPRSKKSFPPRSARTAQLTFFATTFEFKSPRYLKHLGPTLKLNVVYVREVDPPEGEDPVEWILATREPIDTFEQVAQIVDFYRNRWLIEEYFKALKTGCAIESRQLDSYDALLKAIAIFLPIAWQLLLLRHLARTDPDALASQILSEIQIEVLRECGRIALPRAPTVRVAMLAIAALGGHIKNNGDPGWITLWRGMQKLLAFEEVWSKALAANPRKHAERCGR
jgi:hypothetical protein